MLGDSYLAAPLAQFKILAIMILVIQSFSRTMSYNQDRERSSTGYGCSCCGTAWGRIRGLLQG